MKTKQFYTNCKKWSEPSCPQISNEYMIKTIGHPPPIKYIGTHDNDMIDKLCSDCQEFEEVTKR